LTLPADIHISEDIVVMGMGTLML